MPGIGAVAPLLITGATGAGCLLILCAGGAAGLLIPGAGGAGCLLTLCVGGVACLLIPGAGGAGGLPTLVAGGAGRLPGSFEGQVDGVEMTPRLSRPRLLKECVSSAGRDTRDTGLGGALEPPLISGIRTFLPV